MQQSNAVIHDINCVSLCTV